MTAPDADATAQAPLRPGDSLPDAAAVTPWLRTAVLGRPLLFFPELASTNLTAAEHGAAGAPEGLAVVADHQAAGRGRMARTWFSPPNRNLYVTLLLRPPLPPAAIPQLAIVTAIAIRRGLRELYPDLPITIKWPNDLLLHDLRRTQNRPRRHRLRRQCQCRRRRMAAGAQTDGGFAALRHRPDRQPRPAARGYPQPFRARLSGMARHPEPDHDQLRMAAGLGPRRQNRHHHPIRTDHHRNGPGHHPGRRPRPPAHRRGQKNHPRRRRPYRLRDKNVHVIALAKENVRPGHRLSGQNRFILEWPSEGRRSRPALCMAESGASAPGQRRRIRQQQKPLSLRHEARTAPYPGRGWRMPGSHRSPAFPRGR